MKAFIHLFCFYLLIIAVMPCHDGVECSEAKTEIASASHNHSDEKEQCPPFCACACCGLQLAHSVSNLIFSSEINTIAFVQQPTFYAELFADSISLSIWQPPKLS